MILERDNETERIRERTRQRKHEEERLMRYREIVEMERMREQR